MVATLWEVWNDRWGDVKKSSDVWVRATLLWFEAITIHLITDANIFLALNLSLAWFFLFFDYAVTYFLIRNKVIEVPGAHWFSYQSKSSVFDNFKIWKNLSPWLKLLIRVGYFGLALTLILL